MNPTLKDYKRYNKAMVTRELPIGSVCGHKIDPVNGPTNNCMDCWMSYWNNDANRVQIWMNVINNDGEQGLVNEFGAKQVKWFKRFLIAVKALEKKGKL